MLDISGAGAFVLFKGAPVALFYLTRLRRVKPNRPVGSSSVVLIELNHGFQ